MTYAAARGHRSLPGMVVSAVQARAAARGRSPGKLAAFAAAARQHVVTAAALTSVDVGAFHWGTGVGFVVAGASLLAFDFAVTG